MTELDDWIDSLVVLLWLVVLVCVLIGGLVLFFFG